MVIEHDERELYRVMIQEGPRIWKNCALTLSEAYVEAHRPASDGDSRIAIFIDGWREPWPCEIDAEGRLRAVCPTSARGVVRPLVVEARPDR